MARPAGGPGAAKGSPPMKVILHYIKPFIPRMSVGISIKFIGAVMELLLP